MNPRFIRYDAALEQRSYGHYEQKRTAGVKLCKAE